MNVLRPFVLSFLLLAPTTALCQQRVSFTDDSLGIAFTYPASWHMVPKEGVEVMSQFFEGLVFLLGSREPGQMSGEGARVWMQTLAFPEGKSYSEQEILPQVSEGMRKSKLEGLSLWIPEEEGPAQVDVITYPTDFEYSAVRPSVKVQVTLKSIALTEYHFLKVRRDRLLLLSTGLGTTEENRELGKIIDSMEW